MSEEPDALVLLRAVYDWAIGSNIRVRLRGLEERPETDTPISEQLQSVVRAAVIAIKEITHLRSELTAAQHKLAVTEGREPDPEIKRLRKSLAGALQRYEEILLLVEDGVDETERVLGRSRMSVDTNQASTFGPVRTK